jgi:mRNA interferase RelE/StbE
MAVLFTHEAAADVLALPVAIQARLPEIWERLEQWPTVSGAKPLKREWKGHHRIRTGDYRIIFRPVGTDVVIARIMHRSSVYDP